MYDTYMELCKKDLRLIRLSYTWCEVGKHFLCIFHLRRTWGSTRSEVTRAFQSCFQDSGLPYNDDDQDCIHFMITKRKEWTSSFLIRQKLPSPPFQVNFSTSTHPLNFSLLRSRPPTRSLYSSAPRSLVAGGRDLYWMFLLSRYSLMRDMRSDGESEA